MELYIMSKDDIVAKWQNDRMVIINEPRLPIYLRQTGNVIKWLETRAIDGHRTNSRLLKKALRLSQTDDLSTVLSVNAATITDNFWVKPIDSPLTYQDVRFHSAAFATLALTGNYDSFNRAASSGLARTPELTNIGSFEKCWRLKSDGWQMYKKANHEELFSELFVYTLGSMLSFNMAQYKRGKGFIITKDFTENARFNYEPAFSFVGESEDYIKTLNELKAICPQAVGDYVKMLFLDTACANPDRHTFNFGVLTDPDTGKVLCLAPNFDNNMALIARGYPKNTARKNDLLIKLFRELIDYEPSLAAFVPPLSEDTVRSAIKAVGMRVKTDDISAFVMNAYTQIIL